MLNPKAIYKVLWGSGDCGKSFTCALLLYTKWRVNPEGRLIILASSVLTEAKTRVMGYLKDIHLSAPEDSVYHLRLRDNDNNRGIYSQIYDNVANKWIDNDRGAIVSVPVKIKTGKGKNGGVENIEVGGNMVGSHPDDLFIICFDEGQELGARIIGDKTFANWLTNEDVEIWVWGNPQPIDWNNEASWDLLFKLGIGANPKRRLKLEELKKRKKNWKIGPTAGLHLSMPDSPRDDKEEQKRHPERLRFLAHKKNIRRIVENNDRQSAAYYSQVLGWPLIVTSTADGANTVLAPHQMVSVREYPLIWRSDVKKPPFFVGVDPSVHGRGDKAIIAVGQMGPMTDGRWGIDLFHGKFYRSVSDRDRLPHGEWGSEFPDLIVRVLWETCRELGVPLYHVGIETHGTGEVFRYALHKHIDEKKLWPDDTSQGRSFHIVNPSNAPTERPLFKTLGQMIPADELCSDSATEHWVALRCAILNRQMFNVPEVVLRQMYNRRLESRGAGSKIRLEPKDSLKTRGVSSPDETDATVNMLEVMRRNGFHYKFFPSFNNLNDYGAPYLAAVEQKRVETRLYLMQNMLGIGLTNKKIRSYDEAI